MTMRVPFLHQRVAPVLTAAAALALFAPFGAQAQFGGPPPAPRGPAKTIAPIDLTGYWVSIVTEDWRFRMITPPKGDTEGVPLNPAGTRAAAAWDPAKDEAAGEQCKSYGAPAIMRVPGRLHITWVDDNTLKNEADAEGSAESARLFPGRVGVRIGRHRPARRRRTTGWSPAARRFPEGDHHQSRSEERRVGKE